MGLERHRNHVRQIRLYEPQVQALSKERTLFLEGVPSNWPLAIAAQYALRAALENSCTTIAVRSGIHRRRVFSVIDLLELTRYLQPGPLHRLMPPQLKRIPKYLATMGHKSHGSEFGITRPYISVPRSLTTSKAVSGLNQPQKELYHGK